MAEAGKRGPRTHEARTAVAMARLRDRLLAMDPTGDLEIFFIDVARAVLEETGSRACGIARRFPGAALDLALLVPRDGEPARRLVPLSREDRFARLPLPASPEGLPDFHNPMLRELAREQGVPPGRVELFHLEYASRPVLDLELCDPDPRQFSSRGPLERVLTELTVEFKVAVLQERLRRERLEAQLLHMLGRELGRTLDLEDLLGTMLEMLHQVVPFEAAAIYVLDRGGLSAVHQSMRGYEEDEKWAVAIKLDEGLVGWAARTGEALIVPDVTRDRRYLMARPATRSEMVVPLKSGGRVIGVLNLESDRPSAYSSHDLEMLSTFGNQAAAAVERARLLEEEQSARRLEQELWIARKIQQEFLPDPRETVRGGAISGATLFSTEVSGDYYDFVSRHDGTLAVAVADVSGKGMPAALIMSSLRAAFRLHAARMDDPAALCREMNAFLYASLRETEFVTAVFAVLDRDQTVLHYANAGHNPPLLLHADGSHRWLDAGGPLLGAFPDLEFASDKVGLAVGDRVILYTDGVTEAHAGDHEEFGAERLLAVARAETGKTPAEIQNAIIAAVRRHVGEEDLPDDLTIVVLAGCEHGCG